jgi:hypothetical protein
VPRTVQEGSFAWLWFFLVTVLGSPDERRRAVSQGGYEWPVRVMNRQCTARDVLMGGRRVRLSERKT